MDQLRVKLVRYGGVRTGGSNFDFATLGPRRHMQAMWSSLDNAGTCTNRDSQRTLRTRWARGGSLEHALVRAVYVETAA